MGMAIRQEFRNSCRHHENGKVFLLCENRNGARVIMPCLVP